MLFFFRTLLRCKWVATRTPRIAQSVLMGSVTGALACSTASAGVAFVRRTLRAPVFMLTDLTITVGCFSTFCPCVVYSKNRQRLRNLQAQGTPLVGNGDTFDAHCCIYCLIGDFSWVLQVRLDVHKIRIKGSFKGLSNAGPTSDPHSRRDS
jgi:hypothetical protein